MWWSVGVPACVGLGVGVSVGMCVFSVYAGVNGGGVSAGVD